MCSLFEDAVVSSDRVVSDYGMIIYEQWIWRDVDRNKW